MRRRTTGSEHCGSRYALASRKKVPSFSAVVALVLVLAVAAPPQAIQAGPRSVYHVEPALDASVIVAGALAIAIPYAFASDLIHPRCRCDPAAVNALDRHVIGNHNKFLDDVSDVTAGIVLVAPLVLDAVDVGASHALLEDATVFAETLAVNGALVTAAKYTVQRPLPRTYAGDPTVEPARRISLLLLRPRFGCGRGIVGHRSHIGGTPRPANLALDFGRDARQHGRGRASCCWTPLLYRRGCGCGRWWRRRHARPRCASTH